MLRTPADSVTISPQSRASGRVRVPGDKSISHRYAMLAAIADGESTITGLSPGADCAATLGCRRGPGLPGPRPPGAWEAWAARPPAPAGERRPSRGGAREAFARQPTPSTP